MRFLRWHTGAILRKLDSDGFISFKSRLCRSANPSEDSTWLCVKPRPMGCLDVYFCDQQIGTIDLRPAKARGFVDIAAAMPTTPQAQHKKNVEIGL